MTNGIKPSAVGRVVNFCGTEGLVRSIKSVPLPDPGENIDRFVLFLFYFFIFGEHVNFVQR